MPVSRSVDYIEAHVHFRLRIARHRIISVRTCHWPAVFTLGAKYLLPLVLVICAIAAFGLQSAVAFGIDLVIRRDAGLVLSMLFATCSAGTFNT